MSGDSIFLETGEGLKILVNTPYDSEKILQVVLAKYPEVLAGPTTAGDDDVRLLLVRREMSVPSQDSIANFSLDHLFLDSAGVPVLVEVKRSSDTRIRREVVGQLLDYAANAVKYWPIAQLRQSLAQTVNAANSALSAETPKRSIDELLSEFLTDGDVEGYWTTVESNLRLGRVRMVFVADALPTDLVRIIEFLNEQMSPAEVLGVELRQYTGGGHTTYVPHVVGRTSSAKAQKAAGVGGQQWGRESFLEAAEERCSPAELALVNRLLADVDKFGVRLSWGKGATPGVGGWYLLDGEPTGTWALNMNNTSASTHAYLTFYLSDLVSRLEPDRVERAAKMLEKIPSMKAKIAEARTNAWKKHPSLYLVDLAGNGVYSQHLFDAIADLRADA